MQQKKQQQQECPACYTPLKQKPVKKTQCNHSFHQQCLNSWIDTCTRSGRTPTCPYCRRRIQGGGAAAPAAGGAAAAGGTSIEIFRLAYTALQGGNLVLAEQISASPGLSDRDRSNLLLYIGWEHVRNGNIAQATRISNLPGIGGNRSNLQRDIARGHL